METRLRLLRSRPKFYVVCDNPKVSLGIADCSLSTLKIALKNDYRKKRIDILAYSTMKLNSLDTLAESFILPARQNQLNQKSFFNVRLIGTAFNTNSAIIGSHTKKTFLVSAIHFQTN